MPPVRASSSFVRASSSITSKVSEPDLDLPFPIDKLSSAIFDAKKRSIPGHDGVSHEAIAHLYRPSKLRPLEFYNSTWQKEKVRTEWKLAKIVPLLKPGKAPSSYVSFYRIALLSCIGKLMEKMIYTRMTWFRESRKAYPQKMNGFRQNRSVIDNIIVLVSSLEESLSSGCTPTAIFVDTKAAFDSVLHTAILAALECMALGASYKYG